MHSHNCTVVHNTQYLHNACATVPVVVLVNAELHHVQVIHHRKGDCRMRFIAWSRGVMQYRELEYSGSRSCTLDITTHSRLAGPRLFAYLPGGQGKSDFLLQVLNAINTKIWCNASSFTLDL